MIACVLAFLLLGAPPEKLLTVGEKSGYKATARHAEVVSLLDAIAAESAVAHRMELGRSGEDREIPLLVVANPPVRTKEEAAAAKKGGKLVVLLLGNIHAGEVDGKEALPMLARELALDPGHPLLKNLVVVFAPIYNTDGNERVSKDNRPGQVGPEEGMGQRENAAGMDLNRDFIKLECPETKALVRFLNEWDPAIVVDTHTTNGSYHQYVLTYAGPRVPAGDAALMAFVNGEMLPAVDAAFERATGKKAFWYGNFEGAFGGKRGHTRWESFPAEGRYGTSYIGMRNRIGILSEAYSYASYEDRLLATKAFCEQVLKYAAANAKEIARRLHEADIRTVAAAQTIGHVVDDDRVAIRTRPAARRDKVVVHGFVEREEGGRMVSTGEPRNYEVELVDQAEAVVKVRRPMAYLLQRGTPEVEAIVSKLREHGIVVLETPREGQAEVFTVEDVQQASRLFQGHTLARVEVHEEYVASWPHGSKCYWVPVGSPLGNLIVYLLEPECEDGLATWNYFDAFLNKGQELPIARLVECPDPGETRKGATGVTNENPAPRIREE